MEEVTAAVTRWKRVVLREACRARVAFRAVISWEDGEPKISWDPKVAVEEEAKRVYTEIGKTNLADEGWTEVSPANRDGMRFFKVKVELK